MRIAGVYPQKIELDPKIQHAVSEPYGLEKILAVAKEQGHDVELFIPYESEEECVKRINSFNPDVAAFSVYTSQYPTAKKIANLLKETNARIINIAGNRFPTFLTKKNSIEEPFDFLVAKEGEETFRQWLNALEGGKDFSDVRGLVYRENGNVVSTGIMPRNFDLDSLPDALRFPVILNQVYKGISLPSIDSNPHFAIMESSRCCYNACKFCDNKGFWGNRISFRSASRVVDEMFELKEKGVDIFYFMDLNFSSSYKKARELCDEMLKRDLNASWYCMSNTATLDKEEGNELLKLMKQAGCYKIAWGVETTNDSALRRMNKSVGKTMTTTEQTIRVLEKAQDIGIINQGFYIIGSPWETRDSILRDSERLSDIPLHQLNIGIFTPIILSDFYDEMISQGYVFDQNLAHHDRNRLVFNHRGLVELNGNAQDDIERGNEVIKLLQKSIYDSFYESEGYTRRIELLCRKDKRLVNSFNNYFRFIGKDIRIQEAEND